jgi:hypothetical protein
MLEERKCERTGPSKCVKGSAWLSWKITSPSTSMCHQIPSPGRRKSAILDKWPWTSWALLLRRLFEKSVLGLSGRSFDWLLMLESCFWKESDRSSKKKNN